jgi:predicted secreted protein
MNKVIASVFALFIAFTFQSCGPTPEDAIKYNDAIIDQVNLVINSDKLSDALGKEAADMKAFNEGFIKQINDAIDAVKKNGGFDGKTDFMDMAVKYLTIYKGVAENEYKGIIEINSKNPEDITDEDDAKNSKLSEDADKKLQAASDEFDTFQKDFAKRYKFEIESKH